MSQLSLSLDSSLLVRDIQERYLLATPEQILDAARQVIDQQMRRGADLSSPSAVRDFLRAKLAITTRSQLGAAPLGGETFELRVWQIDARV
jgi:DNA repair protein RadC